MALLCAGCLKRDLKKTSFFFQISFSFGLVFFSLELVIFNFEQMAWTIGSVCRLWLKRAFFSEKYNILSLRNWLEIVEWYVALHNPAWKCLLTTTHGIDGFRKMWNDFLKTWREQIRAVLLYLFGVLCSFSHNRVERQQEDIRLWAYCKGKYWKGVMFCRLPGIRPIVYSISKRAALSYRHRGEPKPGSSQQMHGDRSRCRIVAADAGSLRHRLDRCGRWCGFGKDI